MTTDLTETKPAPLDPFAEVVADAIVDLSEIAVMLAEQVGQRPAGRVLDIAVKLRKAMEATPGPATMHIIRRADGGELMGEYAFMACDGPDDWTLPEEGEADYDDEPTEYQILRCDLVATRTFAVPEPDEDDAEAVTA